MELIGLNAVLGAAGKADLYVAVTQRGGHGSFSDPRIGVTITQKPDLVTPKLPALLQYQLSLRTPPPAPGSFDAQAAKRGQVLFRGKAHCASRYGPSGSIRPISTTAACGISAPSSTATTTSSASAWLPTRRRISSSS